MSYKCSMAYSFSLVEVKKMIMHLTQTPVKGYPLYMKRTVADVLMAIGAALISLALISYIFPSLLPRLK